MLAFIVWVCETRLLLTPAFLLAPSAYIPSKEAHPYKLLSNSSHTAGKSHCGRRATIHITKAETFSSRDLALRSGSSHSHSKWGSQHNRVCLPEPRNCQVSSHVSWEAERALHSVCLGAPHMLSYLVKTNSFKIFSTLCLFLNGISTSE